MWQLSESDTLQGMFYVHMHVGKEGLKRAGSPLGDSVSKQQG